MAGLGAAACSEAPASAAGCCSGAGGASAGCSGCSACGAGAGTAASCASMAARPSSRVSVHSPRAAAPPERAVTGCKPGAPGAPCLQVQNRGRAARGVGCKRGALRRCSPSTAEPQQGPAAPPMRPLPAESAPLLSCNCFCTSIGASGTSERPSVAAAAGPPPAAAAGPPRLYHPYFPPCRASPPPPVLWWMDQLQAQQCFGLALRAAAYDVEHRSDAPAGCSRGTRHPTCTPAARSPAGRGANALEQPLILVLLPRRQARAVVQQNLL